MENQPAVGTLQGCRAGESEAAGGDQTQLQALGWGGGSP